MYTMASCLPTATRTTGSKAAARGALTEILLLLHGKLRGPPFPPTPARASEQGEKGPGGLGYGRRGGDEMRWSGKDGRRRRQRRELGKLQGEGKGEGKETRHTPTTTRDMEFGYPYPWSADAILQLDPRVHRSENVDSSLIMFARASRLLLSGRS